MAIGIMANMSTPLDVVLAVGRKHGLACSCHRELRLNLSDVTHYRHLLYNSRLKFRISYLMMFCIYSSLDF